MDCFEGNLLFEKNSTFGILILQVYYVRVVTEKQS